MFVITVGGFKGGTGKTTVAALLSSALQVFGLRVGHIDLDSRIKLLNRFHAMRSEMGLPASERIDCQVGGGTPHELDIYALLAQRIDAAHQRGIDVVVIDTPADWKAEVIAAHMVANLVVTTVNESMVDLKQFLRQDDFNPRQRVPYLDLIAKMSSYLDRYGRPVPAWAVSVNRRSPLQTRVGLQVDMALDELVQEGMTRTLTGLTDRVSYRTMLYEGRTILDHGRNTPLSASEQSARREIETFLTSVFGADTEEAPMATELPRTPLPFACSDDRFAAEATLQ